ncbi:MAG: glycosyltransferase family 4 protein [Armatimonadetes bacterium]|nr:glycosyltransferase family 4 protein [Armatimonadota bacterium]
MRIAIDCRTLLERKTGDRTYIANLIRRLPGLTPENDYLFLLHRPLQEAAEDTSWLACLRAEIHVVRNPSPRTWTAVSLPSFVRKHGVDVLHVQYIVPPVCPCPVVTTIHDLSFYRFPQSFPPRDRFLLQHLIPFSARKAHRVITGSDSTRRDLVEICRIPDGHICVTPYAADAIFQPVADASRLRTFRQQRGLESPFWLSVGVLQPRKNLTRLLGAYHQVLQKNRDVPLLAIAGKRGWIATDIFREVVRMHLNERVRFLGYVPDEVLPLLYSAAEALLYPSLYEGFGLPVLEAMSCGALVLTSNTSSMPEVAGDAGILVDPLSVDSIADGLSRLLHLDERGRQEVRGKGFERASTFSWERTARQTAEVYRQAAPRDLASTALDAPHP